MKKTVYRVRRHWTNGTTTYSREVTSKRDAMRMLRAYRNVALIWNLALEVQAESGAWTEERQS